MPMPPILYPVTLAPFLIVALLSLSVTVLLKGFFFVPKAESTASALSVDDISGSIIGLLYE